MIAFRLENHQLINEKIDEYAFSPQESYLAILNAKEFSEAYQRLGLTDHLYEECRKNVGSKFESYDGFDFIVLNLPDSVLRGKKPKKIGIYFRENLLLFISDSTDFIEEIVKRLIQEKIKISSLGKILHIFFDKLTDDDRELLLEIEAEISDLEEEFIISIKNDLVDYLVGFRKKMLGLKQYYEQLLEVSESIEENDNNLIDQDEIRYFKIITNRINRLFTNVLNLRDYGTQVREAYQAQLDINLNNTMKLFTVITSIFLPLSLIVGWYGMNLIMPEYRWGYGYPTVIGLCAIVVIVTLLFFKKKKWF